MSFPSIQNNEQTLFNAGIAKLQRIDVLKKQIHMFRMSSDVLSWLEALRGFRSELSERMKNDNQVALCDKYELLISQNYNKVFLKRSDADSHLSKKFFSITRFYCFKYELFLNKLEHDFGFGMPNKDDPRFAAAN